MKQKYKIYKEILYYKWEWGILELKYAKIFVSFSRGEIYCILIVESKKSSIHVKKSSGYILKKKEYTMLNQQWYMGKIINPSR